MQLKRAETSGTSQVNSCPDVSADGSLLHELLQLATVVASQNGITSATSTSNEHAVCSQNQHHLRNCQALCELPCTGQVSIRLT